MDYINIFKQPDLVKKYSKYAYKTIIKDLYDNNKKGLDRMVDLVFYEDEKAFSSFGFIPGCFYIFRHDGEILRNEQNKEFHDVIPIFLVMSVNKNAEGEEPSIFGINFNILTKPVRAAILQEINDLDPKFFENAFSDRLRGKHTYSKKIIQSFLGSNGKKFVEYLCIKYKIKRESVAFRKYYIKNISKVRLIDYWQWKYLPFLDIQEGVRGYFLKKLQKEYVNK